MPEQQSQLSSTVAPSDSASAAGPKKSKLGKAERAARRSAVGSQPGQAASASKASVFSSGIIVPKPQPGKFPVVFQTGAGEPSRDQGFSLDERVLVKTLSGLPSRFSFNAKYSEFKAHSEIDDADFTKDLICSTLLRLAQQVVHSHVNLGLPQGDFAPVASTDVKVPSSVAAFVSQYGEHAVPALGTRFLLSDYETTVKSLIWCADNVRRNGGGGAALKRLWLPMRSQDNRTRAIIASRLNSLLSSVSLEIIPGSLEEAIFSGEVPDSWATVKTALGDVDEKRDRFDFLFKTYRDVPAFLTAFTTDSATAVLGELDLTWAAPSAGHMDWGYNAKEAYSRLSDFWARRSATYALFFELSSSQTNRSAAAGSSSQMAWVSETDSVTVLKTHLAMSAPEFSLAACFPATCLYSGELPRRVVMTTPLSVTQRATEFVQMDWR